MNFSTPSGPLIVGMSSSALFDTTESDRFYRENSLDAYVQYQKERIDEPFARGTAFPLAEVMKHLSQDKPLFELKVMSKNEPAAGRRVTKSLASYGFKGTRAAFTGGEPIAQYCQAMEVELFLSREEREVKHALKNGIAAGLLYEPPAVIDVELSQLRVAFDFDGVMASMESELVYQASEKIEDYYAHEVAHAHEPLAPGPLHSVLVKLSALKATITAERKALFPSKVAIGPAALANALKISATDAQKLTTAYSTPDALFRADESYLEMHGFNSDEAGKMASRIRAFFSPIEIAVVTARNPPVEERLMTTLASWGIEVDQMFLMGGRPKKPVLKQFRPHIFFDDTKKHIDLARSTVAACWVAPVGSPLTTTNIVPSVPSVTSTSSTSVTVTHSISAADFDAGCRKIFSRYMPAADNKRHLLDSRFREFIAEHRSKDGQERTEILERLKRFDLSFLDGTHAPKLSRDRREYIAKHLAAIGRGPIRERQADFGLDDER